MCVKEKTKNNFKQECIPIGCVPPASNRMGGLLDRDPPGQRVPWTEIPPGQRPPWTETPPVQRPPDRDPLCEQNHRQVQKHYLAAT